MNAFEHDLVALLRGAKRCKPIQVGAVHFYHFWRHQPKRGAVNVAWIKDLRAKQFAMLGYMPDFLIEANRYLREDRARFAAVNAFVAPTASFANEVMRWYGAERPWFQFANYPNVVLPVQGKRLREIVYVDCSSTVFQETLYKRLFALFDETHALLGIKGAAVFDLRKYCDQAQRIGVGKHIRICHINDYDRQSAFGILVNLTNFAQAAECLPRKLLMYLYWGMVPLVHGTFAESVSYCQKASAPHITYYGGEDLACGLEAVGEAAIKPQRPRFSIEARIGDLSAYLKRLGGAN